MNATTTLERPAATAAAIDLRPELALADVIAEGVVDHLCGRPRGENPYSPEHAAEGYAAWAAGWNSASALRYRVLEECLRWRRAGHPIPFLEELGATR